MKLVIGKIVKELIIVKFLMFSLFTVSNSTVPDVSDC